MSDAHPLHRDHPIPPRSEPPPRPSRQEFERVMRDHNQRLFRIARSIVHDDAEAEDVVQSAYVSAFTRLHQYSGAAPLSGWLARITANGALDRLRQQKRSQKLQSPPFSATESWATRVSAPRDAPSPEDNLAHTQLRQLLEQAIDSLPTNLRTVLILRDVEGMSSAEAADCLELEEGTVRVRLHRARAQLRKWLGNRAMADLTDAYAFAGERCDRIVVGVIAKLNLHSSDHETRQAL